MAGRLVEQAEGGGVVAAEEAEGGVVGSRGLPNGGGYQRSHGSKARGRRPTKSTAPIRLLTSTATKVARSMAAAQNPVWPYQVRRRKGKVLCTSSSDQACFLKAEVALLCHDYVVEDAKPENLGGFGQPIVGVAVGLAWL